MKGSYKSREDLAQELAECQRRLDMVKESEARLRQAEESLRESGRRASAYNRSLIEASLDPLVTIGPDGKITDVNAATEAVVGYRRDELVGTDFSAYFTEPERAEAGYQRVFREGQVQDYALEIRHRDGHVTPVLYNATVYRDESGEVAGVFAAARDITELKRAQEQAQQYQEHLEDMVQSRTAELARLNQELQDQIVASVRRQEIIQRQAKEILEISTPIMQVWEGVVVAPLIGMLDSERTQRFMEVLLEGIVATRSPIALIDISGVPAIDTQTAQNLTDTINAVRLLGAQVVLTGVRPQIAQAMVHLGVELPGIVTRSSLEAGLRVALGMLNAEVVQKSGSLR